MEVYQWVQKSLKDLKKREKTLKRCLASFFLVVCLSEDIAKMSSVDLYKPTTLILTRWPSITRFCCTTDKNDLSPVNTEIICASSWSSGSVRWFGIKISNCDLYYNACQKKKSHQIEDSTGLCKTHGTATNTAVLMTKHKQNVGFKRRADCCTVAAERTSLWGLLVYASLFLFLHEPILCWLMM